MATEILEISINSTFYFDIITLNVSHTKAKAAEEMRLMLFDYFFHIFLAYGPTHKDLVINISIFQIFHNP